MLKAVGRTKPYNFFATDNRIFISYHGMGKLFYIIAIVLIVGWLLGVFYWNISGSIHILIILAIIALLFGIIRRA
jgi:hypothetical protein